MVILPGRACTIRIRIISRTNKRESEGEVNHEREESKRLLLGECRGGSRGGQPALGYEAMPPVASGREAVEKAAALRPDIILMGGRRDDA